MKFMLTKYLQHIPYDNEASIIWHSVFGSPMLITNDLLDSLLEMSGLTSTADIFGVPYGSDNEVDTVVDQFFAAWIFIDAQEHEENRIVSIHNKHNGSEAVSGSKIKYLSLIMCEECNFRCKYCIHFANSEHQYSLQKIMPLEVAHQSIDDYLEIVAKNQRNEAYINFGGGEPLINWPTIRSLLSYIDSCRKSCAFPIKLGINTNMSLMTEEIAKNLIASDVEVVASLDGTKLGNDLVRLTKNLQGTYSQIMAGFEIMSRMGKPLAGFAMTVTEDNFSDISEELIDWAADISMTEIRIDIDVIGTVAIPVTEIISRLSDIRKYAKTKNVAVIGFWSRPAENMGLDPILEDIGFCGCERGNSLCVAPNGQIYPCGYSSVPIGNYKSMLHIATQRSYKNLLSERQLDTRKMCRGCQIEGFCRGGCKITRETNGENDDKINRMCELYIGMTHEILRESI